MDKLMAQRHKTDLALEELDVHLENDDENEEEETEGPFLTQIYKSRTALLEN